MAIRDGLPFTSQQKLFFFNGQYRSVRENNDGQPEWVVEGTLESHDGDTNAPSCKLKVKEGGSLPDAILFAACLACTSDFSVAIPLPDGRELTIDPGKADLAEELALPAAAQVLTRFLTIQLHVELVPQDLLVVGALAHFAMQSMLDLPETV